jgi:hypothetical protein
VARLIVRRNNKGRGVYAGQRFYRGDIIESCPVLLLHPIDGQGCIAKYWWEWQGRSGLPLGKVSLFNHSPRPNVGVRRFYAQMRMVTRALRTIQKGEELLIDYGDGFVDFKILV